MTDGKHTAPVTGRAYETEIDPGCTFTPDDAWPTEFDKQLTPN